MLIPLVPDVPEEPAIETPLVPDVPELPTPLVPLVPDVPAGGVDPLVPLVPAVPWMGFVNWITIGISSTIST
jgi:hypothetical protein